MKNKIYHWIFCYDGKNFHLNKIRDLKFPYRPKELSINLNNLKYWIIKLSDRLKEKWNLEGILNEWKKLVEKNWGIYEAYEVVLARIFNKYGVFPIIDEDIQKSLKLLFYNEIVKEYWYKLPISEMAEIINEFFGAFYMDPSEILRYSLSIIAESTNPNAPSKIVRAGLRLESIFDEYIEEIPKDLFALGFSQLFALYRIKSFIRENAYRSFGEYVKEKLLKTYCKIKEVARKLLKRI